MAGDDNSFHEHLEKCERCRTRPFDLCIAGALELQRLARLKLSRLPISCAKCQAPIRKFATGEEIPCRDCGGLLCERCCNERKDRHG